MKKSDITTGIVFAASVILFSAFGYFVNSPYGADRAIMGSVIGFFIGAFVWFMIMVLGILASGCFKRNEFRGG